MIWGEDRASVGQLPRSGRLCATGIIREYRGSAEVIIRTPKVGTFPNDYAKQELKRALLRSVVRIVSENGTLDKEEARRL